MLCRTLTSHLLLVAASEALPQSFALDMGSIGDALIDMPPPAPLLNTTSEPLSSTASFQTTPITSPTSMSMLTVAINSTITIAFNRTTRTTCLPTTTVTITIPNPTPRPSPDASHGENGNTLTSDKHDSAATPFDSSTPQPLSKWPHWFTAATFTLVCYDILTLAGFVWLWLFGYLWWFRRGRDRGSGRERVWQRRGGMSEGAMEMARVDRFGRNGIARYERTSEWVRTGRGYGRVRSDSWERVRGAREAELESEMRRLGMI